MADLVTLGETLGLFGSSVFEPLEHASSVRFGIGGAESNVAIGVARLGGDAAWIGRVGDDAIGRRVVREIRAEGVRTAVAVDDVARTGLMVKEQSAAGPSRVRYYRSGSAGSRLTAADLPPDLVAGAKLLHVTGITPSLSPAAEEAVWAAIEIARRNAVPLSFDVNHRATLERHRDASGLYRELASAATIVFAGEDEARLLVGDRIDLADAIGELGPREVVVKRGEHGCRALIDGIAYDLDAVPINVVDTVGAGDAFVAGYLAELLAGAEPIDRLGTAVVAGAFACLSTGDWEGLPRRSDLAAFRHVGDPVAR